ncbi:MAG: hypothetical protein U9Q29_06145 [Campylobacterota bacterium]|nr:hypothetical protein [Campylobacterota bacterium]
MGSIDYKKLYELQDMVLDAGFASEDLLKSIRLVENTFLDNFDKEFEKLIYEIKEQKEHKK